MTTDLRQHIEDTLLIDTHEHLRKERDWVEDGPDILQDLFGNYVPADLIAAGATPEDLHKLNDASDPDLAARFDRIPLGLCRHPLHWLWRGRAHSRARNLWHGRF